MKEPSVCSNVELYDFYSLVKRGGQVFEQTLPERIKQAKLLAFVYCGSNLVGVAALKSPTDLYRKKVFYRSKSPEIADKYILELGWCYIDPLHRRKGICRKCIEKLLKNEPNQDIFASTAENSMRTILIEYGFILTGQPYASEKDASRLLSLYILNV